MFEKLAKVFGKEHTSTEDSAPHSNMPDVSSADALQFWSTTEVEGHRVDLFDPRKNTGSADHGDQSAPAGCVLFLHGHGRIMLNDNPTFSKLLLDHNLVAVCPDGQRSWWLDHVCPEFSTDVTPQQWLLDQLVPFIEQRWKIETPHIALLGISMGGQGALQLSYRYAAKFPVVAAISPAIDFFQLHGQGLPLDEMFDNAEEARQATVVLNLHPLAWPRHQWFCCDPDDTDWFDGAVRLGMKLSSSGILHERDLDTSHGGHSWDYFNHMAPTAFEHIAKALATYEA